MSFMREHVEGLRRRIARLEAELYESNIRASKARIRADYATEKLKALKASMREKWSGYTQVTDDNPYRFTMKKDALEGSKAGHGKPASIDQDIWDEATEIALRPIKSGEYFHVNYIAPLAAAIQAERDECNDRDRTEK